MKIILGLIAAAALAVATFGTAHACFSPVSERAVFVVNMPGTHAVEVQTQDLIRVPVRGGQPKVSFDKTVLKPVAVTRDDYIFEVVGAGNTTLKIGVVDSNGQLIRGVQLEIKAALRPTYRGC